MLLTTLPSSTLVALRLGGNEQKLKFKKDNVYREDFTPRYFECS